MNFIFFGRLAREKGFDLLVGALFQIVQKTQKLPGNIMIFGEGDQKDMLFQTFQNSPFFEDCSVFSSEEISEKIQTFDVSEEDQNYKIYFFGWQSQATIRIVLRVSHFSLMPSRFLETFGLSALESLSEGVPVIGFPKGGLVPFIPKELCVHFSGKDDENIEALTNKILEVSNDDDNWATLSHDSRHIADRYTEERWMEQVREILPRDTKKILLASDYMTILGGIETHVQTIAKVLRQYGYEVEIFGWSIPKRRWTKILRLMGLICSVCNIYSAFKIRKKIGEYKPDAIWSHSVSRFLGPLFIGEVNQSDVFSLVTYHDLGLLSPFPSKVESEDMLPNSSSLSSFLSVVRSNNPIVYIAVYCKYIQIYFMRRSLKDISIHIVPSAFLTQHICRLGEIPEEKVVLLEHFISGIDF